MTDLSERAMLVRQEIKVWSARAVDLTVTKEVHNIYHTDGDAGRFNKILISPEYRKPIWNISVMARTAHYEITRPWDQNGARILPTDLYLDYTKRQQQFKTDFEIAADKFVAGYNKYVAEAMTRLGTMYVESDYPDADSIRDRFSFDISVNPMPNAADFRISLAADEVERIKADIEKRTRETLEAGTPELWERLYKAVHRMAERAKSKNKAGQPLEGKFHDTVMTSLRELTDVLPKLNLTNDPDLNRMVGEIENHLCSQDTDEIRTDRDVRVQTAKRADKIISDMGAYMGENES